MDDYMQKRLAELAARSEQQNTAAAETKAVNAALIEKFKQRISDFNAAIRKDIGVGPINVDIVQNSLHAALGKVAYDLRFTGKSKSTLRTFVIDGPTETMAVQINKPNLRQQVAFSKDWDSARKECIRSIVDELLPM